MSEYEVFEGEHTELCIILIGDSEINVTTEIIPQDVSTNGLVATYNNTWLAINLNTYFSL